VIFPGHKNHPQAEIIKRQMSGPSTMIAFEVPGGKRVPSPARRLQADPHLEQSRRRQEPDRPPRDDDASALHAGGATMMGVSDG
jgi:hypothetical protein